MSNRARRLHDSPWQGVFHITGGGAGFLAEALASAGASRTVLEARVPYSATSLAELLGGAPDQACNAATARALAMAALQRAVHLGATRAFGFACTASLATNRSKRGRCRAHFAVQTASHTAHFEYNAFSSAHDRGRQERELVDIAWNVLSTALGLGTGEPVALQTVAAAPDWQRLVEGKIEHTSNLPHDGILLFPGAFNPPHEAHRQMMRFAEARLGLAGAFELSIENVDKPLLDYIEISTRLEQLDRPVWLTRLPRFVDKARRFPGATFVVGIDTLIRIADPRYYGGERQRDRRIDEMLGRNVSFLVFGRTLNGQYQRLAEAKLPQPLRDACTGVAEADFRLDIASTDIRTKKLATDASREPGAPERARRENNT